MSIVKFQTKQEDSDSQTLHYKFQPIHGMTIACNFFIKNAVELQTGLAKD